MITILMQPLPRSYIHSLLCSAFLFCRHHSMLLRESFLYQYGSGMVGDVAWALILIALLSLGRSDPHLQARKLSKFYGTGRVPFKGIGYVSIRHEACFPIILILWYATRQRRVFKISTPFIANATTWELCGSFSPMLATTIASW